MPIAVPCCVGGTACIASAACIAPKRPPPALAIKRPTRQTPKLSTAVKASDAEAKIMPAANTSPIRRGADTATPAHPEKLPHPVADESVPACVGEQPRCAASTWMKGMSARQTGSDGQFIDKGKIQVALVDWGINCARPQKQMLPMKVMPTTPRNSRLRSSSQLPSPSLGWAGAEPDDTSSRVSGSAEAVGGAARMVHSSRNATSDQPAPVR